MASWVRHGRHVLEGLADQVDDLHQATGTPVTARRLWQQTWLDTYRSYEPFAVGVDDAQGRLAALALLATRRQGALVRVVAVGHGPSDLMTLPARDERTAMELAAAVRDELGRIGRPWQLELPNVRADDMVVPHLSRLLRHARVEAGDVSPTLRSEPGLTLSAHVSRSHRKRVAQIRRRMEREGLHPRIRHLERPEDVAAAMPEVERVFRRRDAQLDRPCALDLPERGDFFREVLRRHAEAGQARLTVLELEGQVAAYTLCFLDGLAARMWNCRFDPAWERLSPGKLTIDESIEHSLATGCVEFDFMRGQEQYKSSYANHTPHAIELFAASGRAVAGLGRARLAVRTRLRAWDDQGGRAAEVVGWTRQVRQRRAAGRAAGRAQG